MKLSFPSKLKTLTVKFRCTIWLSIMISWGCIVIWLITKHDESPMKLLVKSRLSHEEIDHGMIALCAENFPESSIGDAFDFFDSDSISFDGDGDGCDGSGGVEVYAMDEDANC